MKQIVRNWESGKRSQGFRIGTTIIACQFVNCPGLSIALPNAIDCVNAAQVSGCEFVWYRLLQIDTMSRAELTEMIVDDSNVAPTEEDLSYDWISVLVESLPEMRNDYAHGSKTLIPNVLRTFDIVCDLVNQLFTMQTHMGKALDIDLGEAGPG